VQEKLEKFRACIINTATVDKYFLDFFLTSDKMERINVGTFGVNK